MIPCLIAEYIEIWSLGPSSAVGDAYEILFFQQFCFFIIKGRNHHVSNNFAFQRDEREWIVLAEGLCTVSPLSN